MGPCLPAAFVSTAAVALVAGCAFERAIGDVDLPDVAGKSVATELAMLGPGQEFANDAGFARGALEAAIARKGGLIVDETDAADVVLTAIIGAFGTNGRSALIGFPGVSGAVIALPEVPIFKVLRGNAYARLRLVTRDDHGRLLAESRMVTGRADFNLYTFLFVAFRSSDVYDERAIGFD